MKANFIIYVEDQSKSRDFYKQTLKLQPVLDVPGMTEFQINENSILGIMPEKSIKKLLGDSIGDPRSASGIPRAEIYLMTEEPEKYLSIAIDNGARLLSQVQERDWGHCAGYCQDRDGHILAFAKVIATQ